MTKKDKLFAFLKNNFILLIFAIVYSAFLIWQMFANGPWYDELYTYYYFISRGPLYAAIHWPVPNNHLGYSVISAFLDVFKNPFLRLRGISVGASIANLFLVYAFSKKFFRKPVALICAFIYAAAGMVCSLGIQGRGYILATTCMLAALLSMYRYCIKDDRKRFQILYIIGLSYGLYILPSSVYWVLPLCITGGLFLLLNKEWKRLLRLVILSLVAAVITFGLYGLVWLAIGSNLMSDDPSNIYYGVYQVTIILKAPFKALKTGMDYMLATPYIQSIDRNEVITGLWGYLARVYDLYYSNMGNFLVLWQVLGILLSGFGVIYLYSHKTDVSNKTEGSIEDSPRTPEKALFGSIFILAMFLWVPVILIIQSVQPYLRVLCFMMMPLAFSIGYALDFLVGLIKKESSKAILSYALTAVIAIALLMLLLSPGHREPLAGRENEIRACIDKADVGEISSIYYTDDFQKYVMKFYYDLTPNEISLEEADFVMVSSEMKDPSYDAYIWPMLVCYDEDMLSYINENFALICEENNYALLKRK